MNCSFVVTPGNYLLQKTVVVLGMTHSGTSAIAGACHHLGVYMGRRFSTTPEGYVTYEDGDIVLALVNNDYELLRRIISESDASHLIWGFKRWETLARLRLILPLLRNVHVISVFRDPVAVATRWWTRPRDTQPLDDWAFISNYASTQIALASDLRDQYIPVPHMLVSYERALANPEKFVQELQEFLSYSAPDYARRNAANSIAKPK